MNMYTKTTLYHTHVIAVVAKIVYDILDVKPNRLPPSPPPPPCKCHLLYLRGYNSPDCEHKVNNLIPMHS